MANLKSVNYYHELFLKHDGIMRTKELLEAGIFYETLNKLIKSGKVEKIRYGYYQWQDAASFTEASIIAALFPDAIICGPTAMLYYDYTDRIPQEWHIAVDNRSGRTKYKLDPPKVRPHFITEYRLKLGETEGEIDGIPIKIYDRERIICDCLRHADTMDSEIYNTAIRRYVQDTERNPARLMEYAKILGVEKKVRRTIGIWL